MRNHKGEVFWHILKHFIFAFLFFLKILVIGLKPSLKVWMTFPYGRVSNEDKQFLFWIVATNLK